MPVFASFWMKEWIYFIIALSATVASSFYHYTCENYPDKTEFHLIAKRFDWLAATCAYGYMYYYIFSKVQIGFRMPLFFALTATLIFFWYGFKIHGYRKLHPWFHIITSVVSTVIVIAK